MPIGQDFSCAAWKLEGLVDHTLDHSKTNCTCDSETKPLNWISRGPLPASW